MRILLVVALVLPLTGCAAVLVGAAAAGAGYLYKEGAVVAVLPADLPTVERAIRGAFDELGLVAVEGSGDGLEAELRARMADGTRVKVRARSAEGGGTEVRIRVGTLGDEVLGRQVLRHIKEALAAPRAQRTTA